MIPVPLTEDQEKVGMGLLVGLGTGFRIGARGACAILGPGFGVGGESSEQPASSTTNSNRNRERRADRHFGSNIGNRLFSLAMNASPPELWLCMGEKNGTYFEEAVYVRNLLFFHKPLFFAIFFWLIGSPYTARAGLGMAQPMGSSAVGKISNK